jgi:hypothetical protein
MDWGWISQTDILVIVAIVTLEFLDWLTTRLAIRSSREAMFEMHLELRAVIKERGYVPISLLGRKMLQAIVGILLYLFFGLLKLPYVQEAVIGIQIWSLLWTVVSNIGQLFLMRQYPQTDEELDDLDSEYNETTHVVKNFSVGILLLIIGVWIYAISGHISIAVAGLSRCDYSRLKSSYNQKKSPSLRAT